MCFAFGVTENKCVQILAFLKNFLTLLNLYLPYMSRYVSRSRNWPDQWRQSTCLWLFGAALVHILYMLGKVFCRLLQSRISLINGVLPFLELFSLERLYLRAVC